MLRKDNMEVLLKNIILAVLCMTNWVIEQQELKKAIRLLEISKLELQSLSQQIVLIWNQEESLSFTSLMNNVLGNYMIHMCKN